MFTDRSQHLHPKSLENDTSASQAQMSTAERDTSLASNLHSSTAMTHRTDIRHENDSKLVQMRQKRGPLPRVDMDFIVSDLKKHRRTQISQYSLLIRKEKTAWEHEPNHVVSFEDRLEILHLYKAHHMSACDIAKVLDKKYSTIRSIILTFDRSGRINKLLTLSAKKIILEGRAHRKTLLPAKRPRHCDSTVSFNM